MIPALLLLIEDDPADAALFCDKTQNELGEVEVEWKRSLGDAIGWLEAGNRPDQIWLDPALPSLGEKNLGKALATLKQYVPAGELRMIGSAEQAIVAREAKRHDVELLHKQELTSSDSQLLAIVQDLVSKRSGSSATLRVDMAKFEAKIAVMEHRLSLAESALQGLEELIERYRSIPFEVESLKDAVRGVEELKSAMDSGKTQIRVKRLEVVQAIGLLLIGSLLVPVGIRILDKYLPNGSAPTPTPTQTQKSP